MKNISFLVFSIISFQISFAQNPNFKWEKSVGNNLITHSKAIINDSNGNIYITGSFSGTVDFDPGASVFNLLAPLQGAAVFVAKYDSSGNLKWAKKMGGKGQSYATGLSIACDAEGFIYTTGFFSDTVDFNPGIDSFKLIPPNISTSDIFISKLDSLGNFAWAKQIGGGSSDIGYSISLDSICNIYLTGYFQSTTDFDPNAGTYNLVSKKLWDIFVCKLDSSGNLKWAKQIGGNGYDVGYSLDVDKQGNVFVTGTFQDSCDFDPGNGTYQFISFGKDDIFIIKLNTSGDFIWAKQIGGIEDDLGNSVKLDSYGDLYFTGGFSDTADFNPSSGSHKITSNGKKDVFISKFDTVGKFKWVIEMGGDSNDISNSLTVDISGNIYCVGKFQDSIKINSGSGITNLISAGRNDIFIFKTDSSGSYKWAKQIGGTGEDEGVAIQVDNFGNVFTSGDFSNLVDFDPGPGIFNQTAIGLFTNIFIQKMKQCSNSFSTISSSGCDSVIVNNQLYKTQGVYTQVKLNFTGCDSIITINVTIKKSTSKSIVDSACDSLRINGIKYTLTGIYTQIATNSIGCDSIIKLNLIIKRSSSSVLNISSCKSYKLNSQLYTGSGIYYQNLKNADGCDSSIKLILNIVNVDTSVTRNGFILTANAIGATAYQWVNCNTNSIIPGEINQDFTATSNGSYAVIVTKNFCTDTSSCIYVNSVGMNINNNIQKPKVFPNPTTDILNINLADGIFPASLKMVDQYGHIVYEKMNMLSNNISVDLSNMANGYYILEIKGNELNYHTGIIKLSR